MDLCAHHPCRHTCLVPRRNTSFSAMAYIAHFLNVGYRWWIELFLYAFSLLCISVSCGVLYLLHPKALAISVRAAWWSGLSQGLWPCGFLSKTTDVYLVHWHICRDLRNSPSLSNHHFTETSQFQPWSSPSKAGNGLLALNWLACCWLWDSSMPADELTVSLDELKWEWW